MSQTVGQPSPAPAALGTPIIRASGIRRSFAMGESSLEVLKGCDIVVRAGEFIAIEGRSGSGKSTLLHILGALDTCDAGTVEFEGRTIHTMGSAARSQLRNTQFGFVFQFYHLLPELDVLQNTLLSSMIQFSFLGFRRRRSDLRDRAVHILKQLGVDHRLRHRPNQLSGGERQRVAIARALMNDPRVLFADEPTGNLDAETGKQIMGVLEKLHREKNQTIIMVTHDRTIARQADRVLILREGKLVEAADAPAK